MADFARIRKECFWDLNLSEDDIKKILCENDLRAKAFLFEKILLNSTKMILDLRLFNPEDLRNLIENYQIPQFNQKYAFRRKNIAEVFFLDKPLLINELKWKI
jgi:hypothetical protein